MAITRNDSQGRFTLVTRNSGGVADFVIRTPGRAEFTGTIPEGETTWPTGNARIDDDTKLTMQGS